MDESMIPHIARRCQMLQTELLSIFFILSGLYADLVRVLAISGSSFLQSFSFIRLLLSFDFGGQIALIRGRGVIVLECLVVFRLFVIIIVDVKLLLFFRQFAPL